MKRFACGLILMCLGCNILLGQDYQQICSPGKTTFQGPTQYLQEYHYDSVKTLGQDSIFHSFYTIHETGYNCADVTQGPILCRVVRKCHDGWFVFLDRNTDSVYFNSQADLNESWICRAMPGNRRLEAKVIDIRQDSVVDTVDTVKVIQFMVKNQNGTIYPHKINGTIVHLSRHFGFTSVINLSLFPEDTIHYQLVGKDSPQIGMPGCYRPDYYDFEVNDEFHYSGWLLSGSNPPPTFKRIEKILEKTVYGNNDSVRYKKERCQITEYQGSYSTSHDTVSVTYVFVGQTAESYLDRAPFEFLPLDASTAPEFWLERNLFNGRSVKSWHDYAFTNFSNPPCWTDPFEGYHHFYSYAPQLGQTYHYYVEFDIVISDACTRLVYFDKNGETWGTPVFLDCSALLGEEKVTSDRTNAVSVYPNPAAESVTVEYRNEPGAAPPVFILNDPYGRRVSSTLLRSGTTSIHRNDLPAGLYLFIVLDQEGSLIQRGKLIFR